jgi:hypothetical protein
LADDVEKSTLSKGDGIFATHRHIDQDQQRTFDGFEGVEEEHENLKCADGDNDRGTL